MAEPAPVQGDADRRVLRRALRAGVAVLLVLGIGLSAAFARTVEAALVWWSAAVVAGSLTTAIWLLLVMGLDMVAGELPSRRRVTWTVVAFAVAFVSPVLPAAALQAASS